MKICRFWALVLTLTLAAGTVSAAFSFPGLDLADAYDAGVPLSLTMTLSISVWDKVSETTLELLNGWLETSRLKLTLGGGSQGLSEASLETDGKRLLVFQEALGVDRSTFAVSPGGTFYISSADRPASRLLVAEEASLPPAVTELCARWRRFAASLPAAYAVLRQWEEVKKEGISIRNTGSAKSKVEYTLTADEWNAAWPSVLASLKASMAGPDPSFPQLTGAFPVPPESFWFEKSGTLKRFLDAGGADLGWQFTGAVSRAGEDARKVTLYGGFNAGKGLYLSLKLPALKGTNNLALNLSSSWKETAAGGSFRLEGSFRRTFDGQTTARTADLSLSSRGQDGAERLTGKALMTFERRGQDAEKRSLEIRPDLLWKDGRLTGTADLTAKESGKTVFSGELGITLERGSAPQPLLPKRTVDLRSLDAAGLAMERQALETDLAEAFRELLLTLPLQERLQLLHDIGREQRTDGDAVPVYDLPDFEGEEPAVDGGAFVVEEVLP